MSFFLVNYNSKRVSMKIAGKILLIFSVLIFIGTTMASPALSEGIKVGIILPLTGKLAEFGEIEKNSFLMAVEEINSAGGVYGKKISLVIEDTAGISRVGCLAVKKLIEQDEVVVIGGGFSSSVTWAASAIAEKQKVPFLINTASADKITEMGRKFVFRLNPPASEHLKTLASFMTKAVRVKSVAILHENTPLGNYGSKKFNKLCKKIGVRVVMKEGYEPGIIDFHPLLLKVEVKKPDLVYIISHIKDASLLLQQARELSLRPKLFLGHGAGFGLPAFRKLAGEVSEYLYSSSLWTFSIPYPGAKGFYERYNAKYDAPTGYHGAEAYAAMYVIWDALKRARSFKHEDMRDALSETDIMTVFGPVKFVSYGRKTQQNSLPAYLFQWINGKLETVWPREVATEKYVYPLPE